MKTEPTTGKKSRRAKFAETVKETMRIKTLESVRELWEDDEKKEAAKKLINSHYHSEFHPMNEDQALKYLHDYFSKTPESEDAAPIIPAKATAAPAPVTPAQATVKTPFNAQDVDQILARARQVRAAFAKPAEKAAAQTDPDLEFFRANADDTSACVAKLREMGL